MKEELENREQSLWPVLWLAGLILVAITLGLAFGIPAYSRYQARANAENQVAVNNIRIQQTEQLVQVERQKAAIRVQDAEGIADAQRIINQTLTPLYIQHEAIQAQEKMVSSPNHTEIYIPSGLNGVPLVPMMRTLNPEHSEAQGERKGGQ